ncbi:MAG: peptidoglycan bridge formation glycyltransferase FemA/FemB family protein [Spirochaetaceae bacterium]|jgi:lipid II:glycine glycyltransferase (peptidoglycan interpeptide bridge formation enzyme)|nr:peptidoglycan bridge formation glycyltransferase FemA/FemB family protein [Spirochaetaceae bacterium]
MCVDAAPRVDGAKTHIPAVRAGDMAACNGAANFLQSAFWARFKARFGWSAHPFVLASPDGGEAPLMVLRRPVARGVSLAYVPWGPVFPALAAGGESGAPDFARMGDSATALAAALRPLLPRDVAFVRVEPPWLADGEAAAGGLPPPMPLPWKKAASVQAPDTVLVDLAAPLDEILARMKSKWRYNVRLGGRKVRLRLALQAGGVGGADDGPALEAFYALLTETAARDKIAIHSRAYYTALFEEAAAHSGEAVDVRLYLAEYEGRPLAGIVTLFRGREAVYLYGASSSTHRECMAPYALQWQAMQDAKAAGAVWYDLFGIPPDDNPAHPMAGLYRFKTGFGGTIVHRTGAWDYAYKPALCFAFNAAQAVRQGLRGFVRAF